MVAKDKGKLSGQGWRTGKGPGPLAGHRTSLVAARIVSAAALLTVAAAAMGQLPFARAPWDERSAAVHAIYSSISPEILGVTEPITIVNAGRPEPPGALFVRLTDANGKKLLACIDTRLRAPGDTLGQALVYFGVEHFDDPGAIAVIQLGPEESALYGLLLRWASSRPTYEDLLRVPEEQRTAEQANTFGALMFLRLLDFRYVPIPR